MNNNEKFTKQMNVYVKLTNEGAYYPLKGFTGAAFTAPLSVLKTIEEIQGLYNEQSATVGELLHENELLNKDISQLESANKTKLKVIIRLREENNELRTKYEQAEQMYKELMEKNVKLQKMIDALMEN